MIGVKMITAIAPTPVRWDRSQLAEADASDWASTACNRGVEL